MSFRSMAGRTRAPWHVKVVEMLIGTRKYAFNAGPAVSGAACKAWLAARFACPRLPLAPLQRAAEALGRAQVSKRIAALSLGFRGGVRVSSNWKP